MKPAWHLPEQTTATVFNDRAGALRGRSRALGLALGSLLAAGAAWGVEPAAAPLPPGARVEWSLERAWREGTPTRERVCLNGLWRWQPAGEATSNEAGPPPSDHWGWFKVPGPWPGITDYMQKDAQTVHAHPAWQDVRLREVSAAWYQREFAVPDGWSGRRLVLSAEYLHSFATVFVDGRRVGELHFPAGELDLTGVCRPGVRHELSLLVVALPLRGVLLSYTDTAAAREVRGEVARRGLCGDVFLASTPAGARLEEVRVRTSVRRGELTLDAALTGLEAGQSYRLEARITDQGREVKASQSRAFTAADVPSGRFVFTESWRPEKLWDLHTPQQQYELELSLHDADGRLLDALPPQRFGFREFWIEGRDFYLNGSRLFLSTVPLDNAQVSVAAATYAGARESLERLRSFGINFVYAHNYDGLPGAHLSFAEILRAADDAGMLVALTQPHFSHYDWTGPEAERTNGYARHAAFYARVAGNHPSVVAYATSHNATGYNEDMNPDLMDGRSAPRDAWARRNVERALRAEALIRALDPDRLVYHHASGNLGPMHLSNFYPNFVPVQELSDWFEPWATHGTKPVFLCEYGAPFTWDWAMYRGWFRGRREFGSAVVPWEFCLAEWNAQFLGDRAFALSEMEKRNLRWEARQFREGRLWHRWDYPHQLGSTDFPEREPVFARYFTDNWRAFRTWGLSANSPWEHHILFKLRPGVDRNRREDLPVDWANLQRPGYSPDFLGERFERFDMAYARTDWQPTGAGAAILRNNRPLLAWLAGKPARFTSKDHVFLPGERFEKQLIVINNSRQTVRAEAEWTLALPGPLAGRTHLVIETGQQARVPLAFALPADLPPGEYRLTARVAFDTGEVQTDAFAVHVLPPRPASAVRPAPAAPRLALFDPQGETRALFEALGVTFQTVDAAFEPGAHDLLVVGKGALTPDGPAPDIRRVRDGLRVLVFEQTADVLEKRFGFRVTEYGLREVFPRLPDHPALAGLRPEHLRDWRGAATLLPPRLKYEPSPKFNGAPTVTWCGLPVTRAWRCGNQGNVASVLIEKPARGDFLPLTDGGFSLQYSPLLEYREGAGVVLFCQMDVTGRTEREPAAERLVASLLDYLATWKPAPERRPVYVGDPAGRAWLEAAGFRVDAFPPQEEGSATVPVAPVGVSPTGHAAKLDPAQLLIVGPGGAAPLAEARPAVTQFLKAGGRLVALGWTQADAEALLPFRVTFTPAEHIAAVFDPPPTGSPLAGIGPADVHCRDPRLLPRVTGGAVPVGDGVLAVAAGAPVVFCQLLPWQFDYAQNYGLKRTFRRAAFLVNRLLANAGARGETPLLARWATPVRPGEPGRWLEGFYLDRPGEWDDPYRFFRW